MNQKNLHHRITLTVRREDEGHGTFMIDCRESEPQNSPEARAIVHKAFMPKAREDIVVVENIFKALITDNADAIAYALRTSAVPAPLQIPGARDAQLYDEEIAKNRATTLMRFLSWLEGANLQIVEVSYLENDKVKVPAKIDIQDMDQVLNQFIAETEGEEK